MAAATTKFGNLTQFDSLNAYDR